MKQSHLMENKFSFLCSVCGVNEELCFQQRGTDACRQDVAVLVLGCHWLCVYECVRVCAASGPSAALLKER